MIIGINGKAGSGKDTLADFLVEEFNFCKISLADEIKRSAKRWWGFSDEQLWGPSEYRNIPDKRYPIGKFIPCGCIIENPVKEGIFWRSQISQQCESHAQSSVVNFGGIFFLEEPSLETAYLTPRKALQKIGTEGARAADKDVWVRLTLKDAKRILEEGLDYDKTKGLPDPGEYHDGCYKRYEGIVIPDCRYINEFEAIKQSNMLVRIKRDEAGLKGQGASHSSEKEQELIPDSYFDRIIDNNSTLDALKQQAKSFIIKQA